ncbi:RDD family protein [Heyndrickxia ginsengihumi]|uniref:RDD family protein n=1 Tax=Heyndrickxia ginsengihumi TaxID=363870 RepID=A0A0A6XXQ5_9BACI|nr:RDD family protein [Heyndrickxia ginsengihumi]KHD84882.1 hypothetical protein NG54_12805 [Heyndrickxia ginsengihumi]MBE6183577.1 RDD family protein [Bacillus sp. (in: firmicutes)]MCM3024934.1 RDD family protein [Heyndrickxia ginsengihumi]NEY18720.1 RDD family protein [Heyndrickxia ginsengihumi]
MDEQQQDIRYAGFWRRFVAYLIDMVILSIPLLIITLAVFCIVAVQIDFSTNKVTINQFFSIGIGYLVIFFVDLILPILYFAWLESSKWQATIGKRVLGLKVIDTKGNPLTFWRALGRSFAMILSGIFYIGYIIAAFTERKQTLHDMIAGTSVIMDERN